LFGGGCKEGIVRRYFMDYLTTSEAAEKWKISRRRVTVLCSTGRIPGALQKGSMWLIPKNAKKPEDGRKVRYIGPKK
jgi:DNA adenine methylase